MPSSLTTATLRRGSVRLGAALLGLALVIGPVPARAQDSGTEGRLRKVESEVRALQRKVFPGTDGRYFEPEITSQATATPVPAATAPSTTPLTDVLARLDALERQMQALTAQTEVNQNAVATLSERVEALEATNRAAAVPASSPAGNASVSANPAAVSAGPALTPASSTPAAATPAATGSAAPAAAAATGPTAQRIAAVQAIAKPSTGDAADDEYVYGFRLYEAGFYPEAQQQLTLFVNSNPRHRRATFGRNLLGRAFLADNKPRDAAAWFLNNYQADKTAARAGDSLLGLAQSMIVLKDTERACIALAEFGDTFQALATGRLKADYERARAQVRCS
jgi:TolA-binding protein